MKNENPDVLLLGPTYPYRGGIANTQEEFLKALCLQEQKVVAWSFSHLYPSFLFPGTTPFSKESKSLPIEVEQKIHAYSPWKWNKLAEEIVQLHPKKVVFRLWTPFLIPCWNSLAKKLPSTIKKIAFVDNWIAHEPKPWDTYFRKKFITHMDAFSCLSEGVSEQIKKESNKPIWQMQHPIPTAVEQKINREEACAELGLDATKNHVLFYGLIRPYKGLDLLLKAMTFLPDIHLLVVGESYENSAKYTQIIAELELENRIHLHLQFASEKETALYFSASDALVLPYKTATQSGVLSLAYHFETPVVVTNHKGLSAPVVADKTGRVVELSPKKIAEGIAYVCQPEHKNEMEKNTVKNKGRYHWDTFTKSWLNFFNT